MKKKLNVFCVLMLVLMAIQLILTFVFNAGENAKAFNQGWQDGQNESQSQVDLIMILISFVVVFLLVRSFVSFIRFLLNVNRDKVFVWDNVSLLRWTGWGFLIANVIVIVYDLCSHVPVDKVFTENTYSVIFCVFCLIVSEVFAIGLKLKEEQDLTI